ncbi:MAG: DNA-binding protein [Methylomonas sp.]|jgi:hypothetical protein
MNKYDFTLKFDISGIKDAQDTIAGALYGNGCDDAVIDIGKAGQIALNFERNAASATEAISSALNDVKKTLPDARLIEATPDFVGVTDIADILACSRQNVRGLYVKNRTTFPTPIHDGSSALWHLAKVLGWFKEKGGYKIPDNLIEVSRENMRINLDRQIREVF